MTETDFGPMVTQKASLLSLLCSYFLFFLSGFLNYVLVSFYQFCTAKVRIQLKLGL